MPSETVAETYAGLTKWFGASGARSVVWRALSLLRQAWPTIKEKIGFLQEQVGVDLSEIAANPMNLTFSLEGRMRPRYRALETIRKERKVKLWEVLRPSDAKFEERFGVALPERWVFEAI